MPGANVQDLYGVNGGVPEQQAETGTGGRELSVRASPEAFGAGIDQAITAASTQAQDTVQKYAGMQNETFATNADAALSDQIGKIKGQYKSLSGQEAVDATQPTIDALNQAFQKQRATLPPMAAQAFDGMAKRSLGYSLGEVNEYSAGQYKDAFRQSNTNAAMAEIRKMSDPDVANDPTRSGEVIGHVTAAAGAQLDPDHPGFDRDLDTGMIKGFKDSPDGDLLKSNYKNLVDGYTGEAYKTQFATLAAQNPKNAWQLFQQDKDRIPPIAAVDIESSLKPQVAYANTQEAVSFTKAVSGQEHAKILLNPSSNGPNAFNLGNVKTKEGAANNTQDFLNPATPVDGVILTANTLRKGYDGMSLSEIGPKWTGEPDKAQAWVANAAVASGLDPNAKLNLNDPATLSSLLKGVAASEKSPKDRAAFTDDVISQGVQGSISGTEPKNAPAASYATNPDGTKYDLADYYATHRPQVLAQVAAISERNAPGDVQQARQDRAAMELEMNSTIEAKRASASVNNKKIMETIFGDNPPKTMDEFMARPGMKNLVSSLPLRDIAEGIPKMIEQAQNRQTLTYSPNAYQTLLRVTSDKTVDPNAINRQEDLDKKVLDATGDGINIKTRDLGTKILQFSDPSFPDIKTRLHDGMRQVAMANGNIDGKGGDRATMWAEMAMNALEKNQSREKPVPAEDIWNAIKSRMPMPSRAQQLAQAAGNAQQQAIPSAAIDYLKANPTTKDKFDEMFGAGSSAKILGAQ